MPRTIRMRTRKCITFISVKHWPEPDKRARHIRQCQAGFLFCLHISQFHSNPSLNAIRYCQAGLRQMHVIFAEIHQLIRYDAIECSHCLGTNQPNSKTLRTNIVCVYFEYSELRSLRSQHKTQTKQPNQ